MSQALSLYRRLVSLPGGRWLYGRLICFKAPYFATIAPRFQALEPGRCEVAIRDRRRVHNHIGTVHAIALCNAAEFELLKRVREGVFEFISVDDFDPKELGAAVTRADRNKKLADAA